jgi:hypothetical protein
MNKQELIAKYGKIFASTDSTQIILQGVQYGLDGVVNICDRYRLLSIKEAHTFAQPLVLHAKTGTPIEGNYPETGRLFSDSYENEIPLELKHLESALLYASCAKDVAMRLDKKCPLVMLTAVNGMTYLQINNADKQLEFSAFFGNAQKLEPSKRSLNADYLHTALSVFKDANSKLIHVKLGSPLSPIVIEDETQGIRVLILPFRLASE